MMREGKNNWGNKMLMNLFIKNLIKLKNRFAYFWYIFVLIN